MLLRGKQLDTFFFLNELSLLLQASEGQVLLADKVVSLQVGPGSLLELQLISKHQIMSPGENGFFGWWVLQHYNLLKYLPTPNPTFSRLLSPNIQDFPNLELATLLAVV